MPNNRSFPFHTTSFVLLCALGLIAALLFAAVPSGSQNVTVKTKPIVYTHPDDGREMYVSYCAPCHGMTGEGNGPAAPAFKQAPTNLTLLAKTHGGKYPSDAVKTTLTFGTNVQAHGDPKMPVWSDLFHSLDSQNEEPSVSKLRIRNLTDYIKTLQAK
jgi:mono/diheme cytochrome c family protein